MSYVSTTTEKGEGIKVYIEDTSPFVVNVELDISFDTEPYLTGKWRVVEVFEGEAVLLERVMQKRTIKWCPGVTTVEYKK
jgi:hypothetical protein